MLEDLVTVDLVIIVVLAIIVIIVQVFVLVLVWVSLGHKSFVSVNYDALPSARLCFISDLTVEIQIEHRSPPWGDIYDDGPREFLFSTT